MSRVSLTTVQKEQIYQAKLQGRTLAAIAADLNCSLSCARKWWRRGRMQGLQGLRSERRGRPAGGTLATVAAPVQTQALHYKRTHPRWGARRVLVELSQQPDLAEFKLPSPSRLATFFKEQCPECIAQPGVALPRPIRPPRATGVHEIWQLDSQEGIRLANGEIATICNIRDEVGAAFIASRAFAVQTARHWRKLSLAELRLVLRLAFAEWATLPDAVLTDNELGLAGSPTDPYPGQLTLWLVGLGIKHLFIRPGCPKDQPQIERGHLILDNFSFDAASLANLTSLQQTLERERQQYFQHFPARAGDCAGRPPLVVHPELLHPRRPYQTDQELALFNLQRVGDYLATFTFDRKVSPSGQISLGRHLYYLGRSYIGQNLLIRFEAQTWQWFIHTKTDTGQLGPLIARRAPKDLDSATLTGLDPHMAPPTRPIQLTLPCFIA